MPASCLLNPTHHVLHACGQLAHQKGYLKGNFVCTTLGLQRPGLRLLHCCHPCRFHHSHHLPLPPQALLLHSLRSPHPSLLPRHLQPNQGRRRRVVHHPC